MKSLSIAVVGCGVAGMAAALLFTEAGFDVALFERFADARPIGAGLLLQPTGLAVLDRLGLYDEALALGAPIERLYGTTLSGRTVLDLRYADLLPFAGLGIHRAALFAILFAKLRASSAKLNFTREIADIADTASGNWVSDASGGRHGPFDLVVGADGTNSTLRGKSGVAHRAPVYDWGCLWVTCRDPDKRFAGCLWQRYRGGRKMAGILPVGRRHEDPPDSRWVTIFWSLPQEELAHWRAGQGNLPEWKSAMAGFWPACEPLIAGIVDPSQIAPASYRDVVCPNPRQGRLLLIGDAAHGTTPQLGQGANLALMDALALATALREAPDLDCALEAYLRSRSAPLRYYQFASRWLSPFFQSRWDWPGRLKDLGFGPLCRFAPTRNAMLATQAGIKRGFVGRFDLGPGPRPRL